MIERNIGRHVEIPTLERPGSPQMGEYIRAGSRAAQMPACRTHAIFPGKAGPFSTQAIVGERATESNGALPLDDPGGKAHFQR